MLTYQRFDNDHQLNISSKVQGCLAQCTGHRLPTRAVLHQIRHRGVSPCGVPYAAVKVIDPAGQLHHALASEQHFGDLRGLEALEGQEVNLRDTGHGLQVLPPPQDASTGVDEPPIPAGNPHADSGQSPNPQRQAVSSASLEEVVSTVARMSRDLNLPTACWIHLP